MKTKLKASALFYALLVSVMIAMICTAMISMMYSYRFLAQNNQKLLQLITNVETGFSYLLQQKTAKVGEQIIDLYQMQNDSIKLVTKTWGLFEVAQVQAFHQKQKMQKTALLGYQQDRSTALSVADGYRPLVLCGGTKLKGNVYRPRAGIKSASVGNIPYTGVNLVEGQSLLSLQQSPLDSALLERRLNYLESLTSHITSDVINEILLDSIYQSFNEEVLVLHKKNIHLKRHIQGQVIIKADSLIKIHSNAVIENAVLLAPFVEIDEGFTGNLQIFASEKVKIHDNVYLKYPSVVSLSEAHQYSHTGFDIQIGKGFRLEGLLLATRRANAPKIPKVKVESAQIMGDIFCIGILDIRAQVNGSVSCSSFQLRLEGKTYNNYLLDTQINASRKPVAYLAPNYLLDKPKKGIVKWLN